MVKLLKMKNRQVSDSDQNDTKLMMENESMKTCRQRTGIALLFTDDLVNRNIYRGLIGTVRWS